MLTFARLFLTLVILAVFAPFGQSTALASAPVGTIAYVVPNQPDGDQIHLIEPDGTGKRLLFRTNHPIPENLSDILTLTWKPDGSELAFASAHEYTCSLYETDIYTIRPDGKNYRRVTAPPACGSRAGLPTGTVTVPVYNATGTMGPFFIYLEGAPAGKSVAVPSGGTVEITFYNVADYGSQDQYAVWMYGQYRTTHPNAKVDVVAGKAVRTGTMDIMNGYEGWGFRWPTYLPGSSKLASIFSETTLYTFDSADKTPGWNGDELPIDLQLGATYLAWAPTAARANQFLYFGAWQDDQWTWRDSIFLGTATGAQGQELFDVDPNEDGNIILGLTWLPDGSGFLYSRKEYINDMLDEGANIYEYSFATKQSRRLTSVPSGFTRGLTVSPDGKKILYEYQSSGDWMDFNPPMDLWMMNRDGSGQALFVKNGRSPAWSRPASVVQPASENVFLPFVHR